MPFWLRATRSIACTLIGCASSCAMASRCAISTSVEQEAIVYSAAIVQQLPLTPDAHVVHCQRPVFSASLMKPAYAYIAR